MDDINQMIAHLNGDNKEQQIGAATSIGGMKTKGADAIPALISTLSNPDKDIRKAVLYALGEIGSAAAAALPAIRQIRKENKDNIRWMADRALEKIQGATETKP